MERDHDHHHHHHHQITPKQQETPPPDQNPKETLYTDSPRNHTTAANDRLKRDEWSEGAVSTLLEAYEAKWTLRNRAKLKGHDWEDVAKHVSSRGSGSKSAKTQTQCKNKIESMKKRYRSESAAGEAAMSSWPLYPRLDLLLRGNNGPPCAGVGAVPSAPAFVKIVEPVSPAVVMPTLQPVADGAAAPTTVVEMGSVEEKLRGPSDGGRLAKEEDGTNNGKKLSNQEPEKKNPTIDETDSSTPAVYIQRDDKSNTKVPLKRKDKSKKRTRPDHHEYNWDIGDSIRWLAEVVLRSEQTRMETMREIERMRAEVEAKRSEMDLKRTEIIANTQLQIAKLFAKGSIQDWNKMT